MDTKWYYEPPDPSVGIFGELRVHECAENTEGKEAEEVRSGQDDDGTLVTITRVWLCPVCGATTEQREQEPSDQVEW